MRAVIYLRVSDPKQEASGLGLEAQEATMNARKTYAAAARAGTILARVLRHAESPRGQVEQRVWRAYLRALRKANAAMAAAFTGGPR